MHENGDERTYLLPGMQPRKVSSPKANPSNKKTASSSSPLRPLFSKKKENGYSAFEEAKAPLGRPSLRATGKPLSLKIIEINAGLNSSLHHHTSRENSASEPLEGPLPLTIHSTCFETWFLLLSQAAPLIVSFLLDVFGDVITLTYAGNYIGEPELRASRFAGIALSSVFANMTGISIMYGMASALETLASQLNGAQRYKEVGFTLQRSCIILGLVSIATSPIWFYSGTLCTLMDIDATACATTQTFLRIRILNLPGNMFHISYEFYLMALGVFYPSMYGGIFYNLTLILLDFLFVNVFSFGHASLAYALVLSSYLSILVQVALSYNHPAVQRTLQPLSWEACRNWGEFLNVGLSATVMLCSEWWAYEVLAMFASQLGADSLSAESILIQTAYLAFIIPLCIGYAVTSVVGNALGAGDIVLARKIAHHSLRIIYAVEIFIGLIVYFGSPPWISFIIQDVEVRAIANKAVPFLSYYALMDCYQGIASGVLKGAGKQYVGAILNVVAFYFVALPMAWLFCFVYDWGVNGLLLGFCFGTTLQFLVLLYFLVLREDYVYSNSVMLIPSSPGVSDIEPISPLV